MRSRNLGWRLETRGYGYGDALYPVKAVAPRASANRVEYRRDAMTEWYENGPLGLEQGFTLTSRPGNANGQPLTVELDLKGDLLPSLNPNSKTLELKRNSGEVVLRYTGLIARDATGRELRSWLQLEGRLLFVRVDDNQARYPLVIDPWIQKEELIASDFEEDDEFGWSVATSSGAIRARSRFMSG